MPQIRNQQDFGAALLFVLLGIGGLWFGREYDVGSASDMGPGYFPLVLSWSLIGFGVVIGLRALALRGPKIQPVVWRAVILVLAAILAFALLIEWAGLVVAVLAVTVLSALGARDSRWKETAVLGVLLAVFCVLVFIYGLRQTMSVFGTG
jgi:putative tricarboxylic transport membrane protein